MGELFYRVIAMQRIRACILLGVGLALAAESGLSIDGRPSGESDINAMTDAAIDTIIERTLDRRGQSQRHLKPSLTDLRKRFDSKLKKLQQMEQSLQRMNAGKERASKQKDSAVAAADLELEHAMGIASAHLKEAQNTAGEKAAATGLAAQTELQQAVLSLRSDETKKVGEQQLIHAAAANKTHAAYTRALAFASEVMATRKKEVAEKNMVV